MQRQNNNYVTENFSQQKRIGKLQIALSMSRNSTQTIKPPIFIFMCKKRFQIFNENLKQGNYHITFCVRMQDRLLCVLNEHLLPCRRNLQIRLVCTIKKIQGFSMVAYKYLARLLYVESSLYRRGSGAHFRMHVPVYIRIRFAFIAKGDPEIYYGR